MVKTRNLKRALQNEALMHQPQNPQIIESPIPRMARTQNPRRTNNLSDVHQQEEEEVSMHQRESLQSDECLNEHPTKSKTRGCTFCPNIWGLPTGVKIPIKLNKFGQPIGDNSSKFTTFLGDLARKGTYCPIDILDWRKVPQSKKTEMLEIVQSKFLGIHGMEEWILQSIGHKWRNWKKHLKVKYFEPEKPFEYLLKNADERVIEEQWKGLITFWLSEEGKKVSLRGKEARKRKRLNHITGRRPFAQIREDEGRKIGREPTRAEIFNLCFPVAEEGEARQVMETMQGLVDELGDPSQDIMSRNDVYSIANGPEKAGRLRTYGYGVTPTDVFEQIPSRRACWRMIQTLTDRLDSFESRAPQQHRNDVSSHADSGRPSSSSYEQRVSTPDEQRVSTTDINNNRPLRVNCSVALLSIMDRHKVVAKGFLKSMEPSNQVGGQVLGKNYCEVHVNVAVKRDEDLIRPYDFFQTVGDSLGISVAWPISLVVRDED